MFRFFEKLKIKKDDLRFFLPLGVLAGILMEVTSVLPERVHRNVFIDVVSDHFPWATIFSILVIQFLMMLFYQTLKRPLIKRYVHDFIEYAAVKTNDFCSPAFSVMLGLSISCVLCSVATLNKGYLFYALVFCIFSFFFIFCIYMSDLFKSVINKELTKNIEGVFKIAGISLILFVITVPFLNSKPIEVSFKLSVGEYEQLEKASIVNESSIGEFAMDATVSKSLEVSSR